MKLQDFYIQIGRLIYSIAKSDGKVQRSEMERFKSILQKELVNLNDSEDVYGTHNAYYAEFELERLIENQVDENEAFTSFILFMEQHRSFFDEKIRSLCYETARMIAVAHHGIEPGESKKLIELERKLNDLH